MVRNERQSCPCLHANVDPAPPARDGALDRPHRLKDAFGELICGLPVLGVGDFKVSQEEENEPDQPGMPRARLLFEGANDVGASLTSTPLDDVPQEHRTLSWIMRREQEDLYNQVRWPFPSFNFRFGFLASPAGGVLETIALDPDLAAIGLSHLIVRGDRLLEFHLELPNTARRKRKDLVEYARLRCAEWRATLVVVPTVAQGVAPVSVAPSRDCRDVPDILEARAAIVNFMVCIHQRTLSEARRYLVSGDRLEEIIASQQLDFRCPFDTEPASEEEREGYEWDVQNMDPTLTPQYERALVGSAHQDLADGTLLRFRVAYKRPIVVTVQKRGGRWLVDLRWWLATVDLGRLLEATSVGYRQKDDAALLAFPKMAVKLFLCGLIQGDREGILSKVVPQGTDLASLFPRGYRFHVGDAELFTVVGDMQLVVVEDAEVVLGPAGTFIRAGAIAPGTKVMLGLFGTKDLVFCLQNEDGAWKVRPQGYLRQLAAFGVLNGFTDENQGHSE